jgi:diguanylate cyclase (GGDEF)-like protein
MSVLPTTILLVEDNPGDARLLREALAEIAESEFELTCCQTTTQALEFLASGKPDVILSDLGLPDAQGLEAVKSIRSAAPDVPLVVLTALNDESLAVEAVQTGAQDYLVKSQINSSSLWRALRYAMERQRVQLEVLNQALVDDLTGLKNRRGFLSLGQHQLKLACRTGQRVLLAFFDLDGLKRINDTLGHQEGNRALIDAAGVLKDSFRQSDILARLGGDEFAALIVDSLSDKAETVTRRIQEKLNALNASSGRSYDVSFSVGIVAADPTHPTNLETLLSQADALMYQEKKNKPVSRKTSIGHR